MFKNIKKNLKNQRGVTLVEMLAVIVIIGIVAAVAVPAVMGQIDKARVETDNSNLQVLNDAIDRYYIMEGSYPDANISGTVNAGSVITELKDVTNAGKAYIDADFPTTLQQTGASWSYDTTNHVFSITTS